MLRELNRIIREFDPTAVAAKGNEIGGGGGKAIDKLAKYKKSKNLQRPEGRSKLTS